MVYHFLLVDGTIQTQAQASFKENTTLQQVQATFNNWLMKKYAGRMPSASRVAYFERLDHAVQV